MLVEFSLGVAQDNIAPFVGCRFVILDAKRDPNPELDSVPFYEKIGFRLIDSDENKKGETSIMFLDLLKN